MVFQLGVISILPEMFSSLQYGVCGKAINRDLVKVNVFNPRDWTQNIHQQVDDKPYGGGPGMVLMYEPLKNAIGHAKQVMPSDCKTISLTPQGKVVTQQILNEVAANGRSLLFVAGRYEGIDERINHHIDEEWSIGDFVLSGGELAAMAIIDAIVRLLPGALGHGRSAMQDSFMEEGFLDHPHYTRPAQIDGYNVPLELISGDHKKIELWRRKQAIGNTWLKKPELLKNRGLSPSDKQLLEEFINEQGNS